MYLLAGIIVLIRCLVKKCYLKKSGSHKMEKDQTCAREEINVEVRLLL